MSILTFPCRWTTLSLKLSWYLFGEKRHNFFSYLTFTDLVDTFRHKIFENWLKNDHYCLKFVNLLSKTLYWNFLFKSRISAKFKKNRENVGWNHFHEFFVLEARMAKTFVDYLYISYKWIRKYPGNPGFSDKYSVFLITFWQWFKFTSFKK